MISMRHRVRAVALIASTVIAGLASLPAGGCDQLSGPGADEPLAPSAVDLREGALNGGTITTLPLWPISMAKIGALAIDPSGQRVFIGANAEDEKSALVVATLTPTGLTAVQRYGVLEPSVQPATAFAASVSGMVLDASKKKLYLAMEYDQAITTKLLAVYDLDANLYPTGAPRNYAMPLSGTRAWSIARHPTLPYLYVGGSGGFFRQALNATTGEPTGTATFFSAASGAYVTELAVGGSPAGSKLYFGTDMAGARLRVSDLDASGAPTATRSYGVTSPDNCNPNGNGLRFVLGSNAIYLRPPKRLYASTSYSPEFCQLGVWRLQANGEPTAAPAFFPSVTASDVGLGMPGSIFVATASIANDANLGPTRDGVVVGSVAVDAQGAPIGAAQPVGDVSVGAVQGLVLAANGQGSAALATQGTGQRAASVNFDKDWRVRVAILAADYNGVPATATTTYSALMGDPRAELRPLAYNAFPGGPITVNGAPSGWIALDSLTWLKAAGPMLKDKTGIYTLYVNVGGVEGVASFTRLSVRIDIGRGNAQGGVDVLKSVTDTVTGTRAYFILPGYGYRPNPAIAGSPATRLEAVETLTDRTRRYQATAAQARAAGPAPTARLQSFPVSCRRIVGYQGSVPMLGALASTIADLGCNVILADNFDGIPVATVNQTLGQYGLEPSANESNYFIAQAASGACGIDVTTAAVYFDFQATEAQLDCWAQASASVFAGPYYGGRTAALRHFQLADEPGFQLRSNDPTAFSWEKVVGANATLLQAFHDYLRTQADDPTYFGGTSWHEILPLDPTDPTVLASDVTAMSPVANNADLARHHLAYYTVRFFVESASRMARTARVALQRVFPNAIPYITWNASGLEWVNNWYTNGMGYYDWFEHGRQNASTLWTEDWLSDQRAFIWSYYATAMRSAAMLGQQEFGGHIVGQSIGFSGVDDGASYKLLSLVGHGAKAAEFYNFGPSLFIDDAFSESLGTYAPIAAANQRLAAAERLILPGRPSRGTVAIQHSATSNLWDPRQGATRMPAHFTYESGYLYYALMHAGYNVDFVDDTDIAANLETRGYTTLYIVKPNLSASAQQAVARWVAAGGTLVAMPGAAVADEFNATRDLAGQPTAILDPVLGLSTTTPRVATNRPARFNDQFGTYRTSANTPLSATMTFGTPAAGDPSFGTGTLNVYGDVVTDLLPAAAGTATGSARVLATMRIAASGATVNAITMNRYGSGRAIAYGMFPGYLYYSSGSHMIARGLPTGWDARARQLVAAAVPASTPRPVQVDRPLVEALRLDSAAGTAIILLNWTGAPLTSVTVTVPNARVVRGLSSVERGALKGTTDASGNLRVVVPLKTVDVLMIE